MAFAASQWFVFALSSSVAARAQEFDLVEVRAVERNFDPWDPPKPFVVRGEITEFDQQQLTLIDAETQQPRQISSEQVQRVVPVWVNDQVRQAVQLFETRQYRECVKPLQEALASGVPRWQQRILISYLVRAAWALERPRSAGILFLNLVDNAPPPLLFADMPLCWTTIEPDQALQREAVNWLSDPRPEAQLLGASWLLVTTQRDQAIATINRLRDSKNPTVARLATAQSWRIVPPPEVVPSLKRWSEYRELLIEPLQLGPTELIADRLQRIGESELAVGQWSRIATIHADRYHRASQALRSAAETLRQSGDTDQADRIQAWLSQLDQS